MKINGLDFNDKMDRFKNLLISLRRSRTLILLYTNAEDMDEFDVGYVIDLSDNELLIAYVNSYGFHNGYGVARLEDIIRVEYESQYARKIEKLHAAREEELTLLSLEEEDFFIGLLSYAYKKNKIVSLELLDKRDEAVSGYIESMEGDQITMSLVNNYGEDDGKTVIYMDDISHAECDGYWENSLEILRK